MHASEAKLFPAVQRHENGDDQQTACSPGQARPCPDLAPGVTGNQVLELGSELIRGGLSLVDMFVAEYSPANFCAHRKPCLIIHTSPFPEKLPNLRSPQRTSSSSPSTRAMNIRV